MKKSYLYGAASLIALIVGCSSENDKSESSKPSPYLAQTIKNYWTYDVEINDNSHHDSIFVAKDTIIKKKTYGKIDTETLPLGFYTNLLNKKGIKASDDKILLSGETNLSFISELPIVLDLNDFVIFKENTANNQILSSISGSFEKDFESYPLKFEYTLQSKALSDLQNQLINGTNYENVKRINITVKGKITTTIDVSGTIVPITIMKDQELINSTLHYVKGVGMVSAQTSMQYHLEDFSKYGINFPFPQSYEKSLEEFLNSYKNIY